MTRPTSRPAKVVAVLWCFLGLGVLVRSLPYLTAIADFGLLGFVLFNFAFRLMLGAGMILTGAALYRGVIRRALLVYLLTPPVFVFALFSLLP